MNRTSASPLKSRGPWQPALALTCFLTAFSALSLGAQSFWNPVGPAGGDARSFAAVPGQPNHIYMGTTNSWIYESLDRGATWQRLSKLDSSDDLIVDHILVDPSDPSLISVAAWTVDHPDGGIWVSHDAGRKWRVIEGLHGQSIRAFVQAPSDPKMLFAGTLEGVFRSTDGGATWTLMSPAGSREIHEVESLAVDPVDPKIVYAGTWHLPWKTTDGGKTWSNVKQGLIDDSDVFSIILDPAKPNIVFLSACSGIYKSENAAVLFHKIQGIPSSARRTRVLKQDPMNHEVVYAGTTEGLYKTVDGGKTFKPMTGPDVIVNDVFIDPQDTNHLLLATDRSGVLYSRDGGASFVVTNDGFSGRKVEALLVDRANPERLFAGVVNDKTYGSVFVSTDGGKGWDHIGEGLEGRDVFAFGQAADGSVLAGTNHGIFALTSEPAQGKANAPSSLWKPKNTIQNTVMKKTTVIRHGKHVVVEKPVKDKPIELTGRVYALDLSGEAWLASTSSGLLTSRDQGASWQGGLVMGSGEYVSVAAQGSTLAAARHDGLVLSTDAGLTWTPLQIPSQITRIHRALFTPNATLWLGTREGVFFTRDLGKTWQWLERLPLADVHDLYYDASQGRILVTSRNSDFLFAVDPAALGWNWFKTGWKIFLIRSAGGRFVAASLYDGVLMQQRPAQAAAGQK